MSAPWLNFFSYKFVYADGCHYALGNGNYMPGSDWLALLRELLCTPSGTPQTFHRFLSTEPRACFEVTLHILQEPVRWSHPDGQRLPQLTAADRRRLEQGATMQEVDLSRCGTLDLFIHRDIQRRDGIFTKILFRRRRLQEEDEITGLRSLTTLVSFDSPAVWDRNQILANITGGHFLEEDNWQHQEALVPILHFVKRLHSARIVPKHLHNSANPNERQLYETFKMYLGSDMGSFYEEEVEDIEPPSQPSSSSQLPSPPTSSPTGHVFDFRYVSKLEVLTAISNCILMDDVVDYHDKEYTKSSSHLTTSFCSAFTAVPLAIDWAKRIKGQPPYKYQQGQESGLNIIHVDGNNCMGILTPHPDFGLRSPDEQLSVLIGEVDSNIQEQDRWRMLANAITLARVGWWAHRGGLGSRQGQDPYIVTAIFVSKKICADIYWTYATYKEGRVETYIYCKRYKLQPRTAALLLTVLCFNLREYWHDVVMDPSMIEKIKGLTNYIKEEKAESKRSTNNLTGGVTDATTGATSGQGQSQGISGTAYGTTSMSLSDATVDADSQSLSDSEMASSRLTRSQFGWDSGQSAADSLSDESPDDSVYHSKTTSESESSTPTANTLNSPSSIFSYDCLSRLHPIPRTYSKCLTSNEVEILMKLQAHQDQPNSFKCFDILSEIVQKDGQSTGVYLSDSFKLTRESFSGNELVLAIQILQSVATLHALDITHRDIQLSHYLWNPSKKHLKLSHFELAVVQEDHESTMPAMSSHSALRAPEMTGGVFNPYKADNWATGLALSTLLSRVPMDEPGPAQFLKEQGVNAMLKRQEPSEILREFQTHFTNSYHTIETLLTASP